MATFERITRPTPAEYEQAAEVCYARFPYQRALDSPERFRAFAILGVELAVMRHQDRGFQCVAFLLPGELRIEGEKGETLRWHYMFQVASLPGVPGAGALLIRQIMQWYPAIFGMGITTDAERLYQAFRWQHYDGFWRGIHPINLSRMVADYGSRLASPAARSLLRAFSGLYNFASIPLEWLLAFGRSATPVPAQPSASPAAGKASLLTSYVRLFESGPVRAADVGGMARLLCTPETGSLIHHAALWRSLRKINAKACEMLLLSPASCRRAKWLGYVPLALEVYCWDKDGVLAEAIPILKQHGLTFLDTDKTV